MVEAYQAPTGQVIPEADDADVEALLQLEGGCLGQTPSNALSRMQATFCLWT